MSSNTRFLDWFLIVVCGCYDPRVGRLRCLPKSNCFSLAQSQLFFSSDSRFPLTSSSINAACVAVDEGERFEALIWRFQSGSRAVHGMNVLAVYGADAPIVVIKSGLSGGVEGPPSVLVD